MSFSMIFQADQVLLVLRCEFRCTNFLGCQEQPKSWNTRHSHESQFGHFTLFAN